MRSGEVPLEKVPGPENAADALTKYLSAPDLKGHLGRMGLHLEDGRAESAPQLTTSLIDEASMHREIFVEYRPLLSQQHARKCPAAQAMVSPLPRADVGEPPGITESPWSLKRVPAARSGEPEAPVQNSIAQSCDQSISTSTTSTSMSSTSCKDEDACAKPRALCAPLRAKEQVDTLVECRHCKSLQSTISTVCPVCEEQIP